MAANLARSGTAKAIPLKEAKAKVIDLIQQGHTVDEACAAVGRSAETYRDWRKTDDEFKNAIASIRNARTEEKSQGRAIVPDFPEFCDVWLGQPLYPHQLQMWDVIEGREPRDIHEAMDYEPGYLNRVLINVPPEHAKSTTFTVNYVVWLIHKNPDIRVVLVSKGLKLAQDFLYEIKLKLTSPLYREMHLRFAPEGGWKDEDGTWAADRIYVKGKNENGVQKDPTVQAMGLKGQIYGRRADLIILDDIIDAKNSREVDFQLRLINRDIDSRLPSEQEGGGLLLVLGTRVAPMDIYRTLMEIEDGDSRKVWTTFRMPAVLDYGTGDSETWTTLWPEKWSGPSLSRRRIDAGWNLYYQQLDIDDDMTFKAEAVNASVNGQRFPGPLTEAGAGHRDGGMDGLYVAGGLDPATVGNTAMVVSALDKNADKRFILDGFNKANCSPSLMRQQVMDLTDTYHINEWVIERNAFQRFLTQDPELVTFLRSRGCKLTEHYTTSNKYDEDWGVQTMGPLFDSCVEWDDRTKRWVKTAYEKRHIELPAPRQNEWVNDLIQQLTIWQPKDGMAQKAKTDLVMALWFTHIAHSRVMQRKRHKLTHLKSAFMTPNARKRQGVIDLAALRRQVRDQREGLIAV